MAMLFHYNPATVRLTLLINDYKYLRDSVKTADIADRETVIYLRDAHEWALNRRFVRVIHGIPDLMAEEPSAALSDFLTNFFNKKSKIILNYIYGEVHNAEQAD